MKRRSDSYTVDLFDERWAWLFATEPISESLLAKEDNPSWTEEEILHLYEYMLQVSLERLADGRNSVDTRMEIFCWVSADDDGGPFSFANCCLFCGLDPDTVRDGVIGQMTQWRQSLH